MGLQPAKYALLEHEPKANKDMTTPLAFQDEMPVFKRLDDVAKIANMTPEEYQDYIDDLDRQRTKYAQMEWAKKKARMEGEAIGETKGYAKANRDHAIAFNKAGASIEMIATALNMSIEEVEALLAE